mmetsp:Transcript_14300/g.21659  ORF Transcript_14300/g.21659 Transcript_14300/m.21659 type:complete len:226 (-) Transcript_14300:242-919(-)
MDRIVNDLPLSLDNQIQISSSSSTGSSSSGPRSISRSRLRSRPRGRLYLIITNIAKKPNIKSLLRTAVAFGCQTIFVAGQRKFNFDHNTDDSDVPTNLKPLMSSGLLRIVKFDKLEECVKHIKSLDQKQDQQQQQQQQQGGTIRILGVEIDEAAVDVEEMVTTNSFQGDTAFMMGNEGSGMNEKQMSLCDGFVKIKQYGGGTASLNVSVAAGIVLHRFHHWAYSD